MECIDDPPWPEPLGGRLTVGADAEQVADVILTVWQEIDQALNPIIGHRGVAALYNRSLNLTAARYPWLAAGHQGVLAAVDLGALKAALAQRAPAEAAVGGCALLQSFHALLCSLVGASPTGRLLVSVWPQPAGAVPAQDTAS
jgi:hypothetical protein